MTLSVYSLGSLWPILSTDWQMGLSLVPASQLPVSALLSELETHVTSDHPDTGNGYIRIQTLLISVQPPLIFPFPPPLLISNFYFQVSMQSQSHSLAGLGSYPLSHSHLPPIKAGGGPGGVAAGSPLPPGAPPQTSPDLECGPVSSDYNEKSPNTWKYQSFQVL